MKFLPPPVQVTQFDVAPPTNTLPQSGISRSCAQFGAKRAQKRPTRKQHPIPPISRPISVDRQSFHPVRVDWSIQPCRAFLRFRRRFPLLCLSCGTSRYLLRCMLLRIGFSGSEGNLPLCQASFQWKMTSQLSGQESADIWNGCKEGWIPSLAFCLFLNYASCREEAPQQLPSFPGNIHPNRSTRCASTL